MEIKRRRFQGVLNILSFNRHFYVTGLLVLVLIFASQLFLDWPNYLLELILILFLYGLITPLLVSAYVYDFSKFYDFNWLKDIDISSGTNIVNINAGFDETSFIIKSKLPNSNLQVFDFYDEKSHTEPAIKRARKVSLVYPNTKVIKTDNIPLENESVDVVFLISSAHEIRSHKEKVIFLNECNRVLKPEGKVIIVEHLRDIPNFLAFSIGVTHFFSKNTWKSAFKSAKFNLDKEQKFTPFMSIFRFNKTDKV